ncbi:MAG: acyl-CoA dehydrogenase family protein, partial [Hyphomicrobiaceae bacterium]
MDFDFSDEQRQLKDSLDRLLADQYSELSTRFAYQKEPGGYSAKVWQSLADLGALAIPFAEEHGGLGQGAIETMIVMESLGRALSIDPFVPTVVLAGGVLRHAGSAAQQSELTPGIVAGTTKLALAHLERDARYDLAHVGTTAKGDGKGGFVLEG